MQRIIRLLLKWWYFGPALFVAGIGLLFLLLAASGFAECEYDEPDSIYSQSVGKMDDYLCSLAAKTPYIFVADQKLNRQATTLKNLMRLKLYVDYFPGFVILPAFLVASGGWALDSICRRKSKANGQT